MAIHPVVAAIFSLRVNIVGRKTLKVNRQLGKKAYCKHCRGLEEICQLKLYATTAEKVGTQTEGDVILLVKSLSVVSWGKLTMFLPIKHNQVIF